MPEADAAQAEEPLARAPDRPSAEPPGLESPLGPAAPAASVLRMQRLVGNRAVGRMLAASRRTLARDPDPYDRNVSRWIKLEPRSVALNAPNVSKMTLTASPVVPWEQGAEEMLTNNVQKGDKHLVFNCHGFASRPNFATAHLSIGTVLHLGNVGAFDRVAGMVGVIWISACNILSSTVGEDFCKAMAKHAGAYVVAPTLAVTQNNKKDNLEDTAGAMWKYIDPKGEYLSRTDFIALGPSLGFTYERKSR